MGQRRGNDLRCSLERSTIAFVVFFFFSKGVTREVLYTYLFRVLQRG